MAEQHGSEPDHQAESLKRIIGLTEEEECLVSEAGREILPILLDRVENDRTAAMGREGEETRETEAKRDSGRHFLKLLLSGRYDGSYMESRDWIFNASDFPSSGWFPWKYSAYGKHIPRIAHDLYRDDPERLIGVLTSIWKVFLFDMETICHGCRSRAMEGAHRDESPEDSNRGIPKTQLPSASRTREAETDPIMILVIFRDGRIADINPTALHILGYRWDEITGVPVMDMIPESQHARLAVHFERVERNGHDHMRAHLLAREGERKHVELISTALFDNRGLFRGTRIFIRDLTGQNRLEEEKSRWERLVAVGSMAAKVAHEIRNPLSSISLNVELLLDEIRSPASEEKPEAVSLINSILSEIDRLTNVIEEYLSFGRLPSPSLTSVSVREFLLGVGDFVGPDLRGHGIGLVLDILPGTPPLLIDQTQARQGLLNLFRNAREAMPSGGEIRVTAGPCEDGVLIEVEDNGNGIPPEKIDRIFDPFYTTKDFGTGLGLAFVQQVMREHGGRITCRSRVGKGTAFGLHFPAGED